MKSTDIENWFSENISLFPGLEGCKKYFENLEGTITEFSTLAKDNTHRFEFKVESSLNYKKPLQIIITYNEDWNEIESYSQKQLDTTYNTYYGCYDANVSYNNYYDGGF